MLKNYAEKHLEDIKNFPKYTIVPYTPKVDKNDIPIYSNSESNNQKKEQLKMQYQWLEGNWKGKLFVHAMEESFPAELKYNHGKLEIFAKEYCQGKATFSSKQNNDSLSIKCKDNYFKLTPTDNNNFETIYIEYNNKDRFAGWLKKEK
jgi:hypothetical protein